MWLLGRNRLLLPFLLLLLPQENQSADGCGIKEGGGWRCGDVCTIYIQRIPNTFTYNRHTCNRNGESFGPHAGKWCCGGTNCTGGCLQWHSWKVGWCLEWSPGICTTGVALNLTQSCEGSCNYFGEDEDRNYASSRSYVGICTNTSTCVKEGEGIGLYREEEGHYNQTICTGNSSCEGELDWCREEARKKEKCPGNLIRCPGISSNKEGGNGTKFIPGQCIEPPKMRDGKENNCLDRSDEDPFQEAAIKGTNKETIIDFGRIKNCTAYGEFGDGLECGVQQQLHCVGVLLWCLDKEYSVECPVLGAGIHSPHPPPDPLCHQQLLETN